jgi:hypothetical protein
MTSPDFDFLYGQWHVQNRKLANTLDPSCTEWVEFEATQEASPILGGIGNIDFMKTTLPGGEYFEGMSLRLYDPSENVWRIYWSSTGRPGVLEPPVIGSFVDGVGIFVGDDVLDGQPAKVRFTWDLITGASARWSQAFSFDDGQTWGPENWTMTFTRL